jgi:hypothetical protein
VSRSGSRHRRLANHRVRFTLGSHIQFGSLDFLCTGVDHDLVLLPPFVPVNPASPSGCDERVRELDPTGTEGEYALPSPAGSPNSPADIDSITKSMAGLCLHASEAQASRGTQPHGFDYPRLECQFDAILGPRPSQEDLHRLYFVFANALSQLSRGPPLSPEVSAVPTQPARSYELHNAVKTFNHLT